MRSRNSSEKNGLVIADSGAIFSLAVIDQLEILNALFLTFTSAFPDPGKRIVSIWMTSGDDEDFLAYCRV